MTYWQSQPAPLLEDPLWLEVGAIGCKVGVLCGERAGGFRLAQLLEVRGEGSQMGQSFLMVVAFLAAGTVPTNCPQWRELWSQ